MAYHASNWREIKREGATPSGHLRHLVLWIISSVTHQRTVPTFLDAKRLECAELAPAFGRAAVFESASKLDALQTLRDTGMPFFLYVSVLMAAPSEETLLWRWVMRRIVCVVSKAAGRRRPTPRTGL